MKILLVDDHTSFCEGLQAALTAIRHDYQVDFETDAELIPRVLVERRDYDLFILDLMMPGLGGIKLLQYLRENDNRKPVMILSSAMDFSVIRQAFELGVTGFMPKSYSVYQIIDAIEQGLGGEVHVPAYLARAAGGMEALVFRGDAASGMNRDAVRPILDSAESSLEPDLAVSSDMLTRRQMEILSLIDKGLTNQEIANALFISKATVKTHIDHLFRIFRVNNRINCLRAAKQVRYSEGKR